MPRHLHIQLKCNNLQETKRKNIYTTFCVVRFLSESPQGILVLKTTFTKWLLLRHEPLGPHVYTLIISERKCLFTQFCQLPYQLNILQVVHFESPSSSDIMHKGLVINYGEGGLQNGKTAGAKLFAPPPQDRVKLFAPPPF